LTISLHYLNLYFEVVLRMQNINNTIPGHRSKPPPPVPFSANARTDLYIALYDYQARTDDDISFRKGWTIVFIWFAVIILSLQTSYI